MWYTIGIMKVSSAETTETLIETILSNVFALRHHLKVHLDPRQHEALGSLTVHQLEGLSVLSQGDRTMQEFCTSLDISESAGTALVDRLMNGGYVVRDRDPSDRRIVRISLSKEASEMVLHYRALARERAAKLFEGFDRVELEEFARLLVKANNQQSELKK